MLYPPYYIRQQKKKQNTYESKKAASSLRRIIPYNRTSIKRIQVLTGINPEMTGRGSVDPTLIFYREMTSSTNGSAHYFFLLMFAHV